MSISKVEGAIGLVAAIVVGAWAVDARFASSKALEAEISARTAQIEALTAAIAVLEAQVQDGHDRAEIKSKIYTEGRFIDDLIGRHYMYRALDQADVITPAQRDRWDEVREAIEAHQAQVSALESDLDNL